jgi:hypothetical protein
MPRLGRRESPLIEFIDPDSLAGRRSGAVWAKVRVPKAEGRILPCQSRFVKMQEIANTESPWEAVWDERAAVESLQAVIGVPR